MSFWSQFVQNIVRRKKNLKIVNIVTKYTFHSLIIIGMAVPSPFERTNLCTHSYRFYLWATDNVYKVRSLFMENYLAHFVQRFVSFIFFSLIRLFNSTTNTHTHALIHSLNCEMKTLNLFILLFWLNAVPPSTWLLLFPSFFEVHRLKTKIYF